MELAGHTLIIADGDMIVKQVYDGCTAASAAYNTRASAQYIRYMHE